MTQNYNNINFFNRENYNALCAKVGECVKKGIPNADKLLESLEERCSAFLDYVNTVDMGETRIIIAHNRLEGEDLRDALQTIDRLRKCYREMFDFCGCSYVITAIHPKARKNVFTAICLDDDEGKEKAHKKAFGWELLRIISAHRFTD